MGASLTRWAAASLALASFAVCAQPAPPGGGGGRGGTADRAGSPGLGTMRSPDDARQWLVSQSARQLADARQALQITSAQAAAWDAYAASVGALASDVARFDADPLTATSLQRIDRRVDRARNRYTALENVADSMRALYAVLSEEQRATADRVLAGTVPSLYEGNPFAASPLDASLPPGGADGQKRRPGRGDQQPR